MGSRRASRSAAEASIFLYVVRRELRPIAAVELKHSTVSAQKPHTSVDLVMNHMRRGLVNII
eukprot:scaffold109005_cov41-Cyclotella_meneghiniana.AAC.2